MATQNPNAAAAAVKANEAPAASATLEEARVASMGIEDKTGVKLEPLPDFKVGDKKRLQAVHGDLRDLSTDTLITTDNEKKIEITPFLALQIEARKIVIVAD